MAEQLGVPATAVMTTQFVSAAELMARVLGADGYGFVTVQHPIASATLDQLTTQAATAAVQCASKLTL